MNSKVILFALLSMLIGFSACNHSGEPEIDQHANSIPLINKILTISGNYKDSVHYEYDNSGRLIKEFHSEDYYTKYTHKSGKIIMEFYLGNTTPENSYTILVNEEGLATRSYSGIIIPDIISTTYRYNSNGYWVLTKNLTDTVATAKILDGNTIVRKDFARQDKLNNTTKEYQFLTNINTIGDENRGMTWEGKQNKNLPSKETEVWILYNLSSETISEYTYEYDTQNRVSKRTWTRNGVLYDTEFYTYY